MSTIAIVPKRFGFCSSSDIWDTLVRWSEGVARFPCIKNADLHRAWNWQDGDRRWFEFDFQVGLHYILCFGEVTLGCVANITILTFKWWKHHAVCSPVDFGLFKCSIPVSSGVSALGFGSERTQARRVFFIYLFIYLYSILLYISAGTIQNSSCMSIFNLPVIHKLLLYFIRYVLAFSDLF